MIDIEKIHRHYRVNHGNGTFTNIIIVQAVEDAEGNITYGCLGLNPDGSLLFPRLTWVTDIYPHWEKVTHE